MMKLHAHIIAPFLLLAFLSAPLFPAYGQSETDIAVLSAKGPASWSADGSDWAPLTKATILRQGDFVKTDAGGEALLQWGPGHTLKIYPFTKIELSQVAFGRTGRETTSINLSQGKILTKAQKLRTADSFFEVRTPTAIAGVRGTELGCAFDPASAEASFTLTEGQVAVEIGGETILLGPDQFISLMPNLPPPAPEPIPPAIRESFAAGLSEVRQAVEPTGNPDARDEKIKTAEPAAGQSEESAAGNEALLAPDETAAEEVDNIVEEAVRDAVDEAFQNAVEDSINEFQEGEGGLVLEIEIPTNNP